MTNEKVSVTVSDMKVTSRDFQRNFALMKERATAGETVVVVSGGEEFFFRAAKPKTWQGALKGKGKIMGDVFSTGLSWENAQ